MRVWTFDLYAALTFLIHSITIQFVPWWRAIIWELIRNHDLDLMHAGIEACYVPMSQAGGEKGIDVALAIDAMQVGLQRTIDIAALVTGDGDFVPLVRALMKHGIPVAAAYFEYKDERGKSFMNERLLNAYNYSLNVNSLERDRKYQSLFRGLFRHFEKRPGATKT